MIKTSPFYDLYIQESFFFQEDLEQSISLIYNLGYRTIAVNQTVEDGNIELKKKKKKGEPRETSDIVPQPYSLSSIEKTVEKLKLENFRVFNRLTVVFSSQDILHKIIKSPNYKKFHIIAASPTTMQALTYTCSSFDADIFTFNPENKFNLRLNRKSYNQLTEKGYHFEILYSAAIEDTTKRTHLIHAAHLYHTFGKSRNIIFSSGAHSSVLLRSPYDVINFGFIFGLSQLQCKTAVSYCPNKVILNSVGRRQGKAVMFVENVSEETAISIDVLESEDEDIKQDEIMESDQPKQKKTKI